MTTYPRHHSRYTSKPSPAPMRWRTQVGPGDPNAIRELVVATGFFSAGEVAIAMELVRDRLARGTRSDYNFVLAEQAGRLLGYACYGPIAGTVASFDLYWIVVDPEQQRAGLGTKLLEKVEHEVAARRGQRIYVDTSSRSQYAPTRAFYERNGYRNVAQLPDFYAPGDGKVIYEKTLSRPR